MAAGIELRDGRTYAPARLKLDPDLQEGTYRPLTNEELETLRSACGF